MAKLKKENLLSMLNTNLRHFSPKEYIFIMVLVPFVSLSIYLFPDDIKALLALYNKSVLPWALLTSNFVHFEVMHLVPNIASYLVFAFLTMLFEQNKKRFFFMLSVVLVIAPVVSSFLWILAMSGIQPDERTFGFSTSVYCLFGYLVYVFFDFFIGTASKKNVYVIFSVVFVPLLGSFLYADVVSDGVVVNVLAHYIGFGLGGVFPLFWSALNDVNKIINDKKQSNEIKGF